MTIQIRQTVYKDQSWISSKLTEIWETNWVISRGKRYCASILPGFAAKYQGSAVGLVTFQIEYQECQIITLIPHTGMQEIPL